MQKYIKDYKGAMDKGLLADIEEGEFHQEQHQLAEANESTPWDVSADVAAFTTSNPYKLSFKEMDEIDLGADQKRMKYLNNEMEMRKHMYYKPFKTFGHQRPYARNIEEEYDPSIKSI
jgi:hypothetical protein